MNYPVAQIKAATDIVALISEHVPLKKTGNRYVGRCPFHEEKTPSFSVNAEHQYFRCFGCDAKGDVFVFIQAMQRVSFREACRFLAERAGIQISEPEPVAAAPVDRASQSRQRTYADQIYKEATWWRRRTLDKFYGRVSSIASISRGVDELLADYPDADVLWIVMVRYDRRAALWQRIIDRLRELPPELVMEMYLRRRDQFREEYAEHLRWVSVMSDVVRTGL